MLLGLPLWGVRLDKAHITRRPPASTDVTGRLHAHVARLREDDVAVVDGVAVTSPVRTALDLARSLPFEPAVVILDAVLHTGASTREVLAANLADIADIRGAGSAARALAFADGRSESVGASRSRIVLHRVGLAPSVLQLDLRSVHERLRGRSDSAGNASG